MLIDNAGLHAVRTGHFVIHHVCYRSDRRRRHDLKNLSVGLVNAVHLVTIAFIEDKSAELEVHHCGCVEFFKPLLVFSLHKHSLSWNESERLDGVYVHHLCLVVLILDFFAANFLFLEGL